VPKIIRIGGNLLGFFQTWYMKDNIVGSAAIDGPSVLTWLLDSLTVPICASPLVFTVHRLW